MPIVLKEVSGPQIPTGVHLGICYRIADVGTQPDTGFGAKRKIILSFELPHERTVFDGVEKPLGISRIYSSTLNKKANLRKDLEAWRGRAFTAEELNHFQLNTVLGKPCQVNVSLNETGKAVATSIVGVPKGMAVPSCFNPLVEYSIEDGKNAPGYATLPDWIKAMADSCHEWNNGVEDKKPDLVTDIPASPGEDDTTPF